MMITSRGIAMRTRSDVSIIPLHAATPALSLPKALELQAQQPLQRRRPLDFRQLQMSLMFCKRQRSLYGPSHPIAPSYLASLANANSAASSSCPLA